MRRFALLLIRTYQRRLSPHKGFHCAYRSAGGSATCSQLGYRAIRRFGVWQGVALLRLRLARCADTASAEYRPIPRAPLLQRGDCDLGCGPDLDPGDSCDGLNACNGCDWPARKQKKKKAR
ncbi:MAG: membrane protein insertion efficiency factor YidD [Ahniella sp.]|nr:membrane protein insertion efficiency factor YidD [Ahniella sp.]